MGKAFLMITALTLCYSEAFNRIKCIPPYCTTAAAKPLADDILMPNTLESLTLEEATEITELINERRQDVTPPPSNMNRIVWDSRLAVEARDAISECSKREKNLYHAVLGELGFFVASTDIKSVSIAVNAWYSQLENFNQLGNVCLEYRECGGYTQMMFARTKGIGCFWNRCLLNNGYIIGCAYYPKYKTKDVLYAWNTPPCSRCEGEDGGLCYKGLCSTKAECKYLYPCECNLKCQFGAELNTTSCRCNCDEITDYKHNNSLDCGDPCQDCKEEETTVEEITTATTIPITTTTTEKPPSVAKVTAGQEGMTLKTSSIPMNTFYVTFLIGLLTNYN